MSYERIDEAFAAYHAFVDNMLRSDGLYRLPADRDMKHWHAIAKMARRHDVSPETLISARFAGVLPHLRRSLRPSSIYRPASAVTTALNEFAPDRARDHRKSYGAAKGLLLSLHARMPRVTKDQLLGDPEYGFPAWFRVLHVSQVSDMLRDCYLTEAKEEYQHDQGLRTFIAEELHGFNAERLA